jgi:hypothetical protein
MNPSPLTITEAFSRPATAPAGIRLTKDQKCGFAVHNVLGKLGGGAPVPVNGFDH